MNGMIMFAKTHLLKLDLEEDCLHFISETRSLYGIFKLPLVVSYVKFIAATHKFICAITFKIDREFFFLEVFQFRNSQLDRIFITGLKDIFILSFEIWANVPDKKLCGAYLLNIEVCEYFLPDPNVCRVLWDTVRTTRKAIGFRVRSAAHFRPLSRLLWTAFSDEISAIIIVF